MKKYIAISAASILLVIGLSVSLVAHGHNHTTIGTKLLSQGTYVALGDSVAAGVGLKYDTDSSACDRTNQAYSDIVATHLIYSLSNIACSGATLADGVVGNQDVNNVTVAPQLKHLFARPKPKLITITIGANDVDWTGILEKCYVSECGSSADTATV